MGKDSKSGDFCAILSVFWRPKHRFLYVYTDMKRRPNGNIVDRIFELNEVYQYDAFAFETNGFQAVLADTLVTKSAETHVNLPLVMVNHTKPKKVRIRRLGTYLEHRFIKFRDQSADSMAHIKQLKMYPIGDHDDGPDCLEMVIFEINEFNMARNRVA